MQRQNAYTVLSWCLLRSLGCSPVTADQLTKVFGIYETVDQAIAAAKGRR